MSRNVEVLILDQRLRIDEKSVGTCLMALAQLTQFTVPQGDLEVAFVDPSTCSRLHGDFFDDPDLTDVMTFPGDPEDGLAGNIAICPQIAAEACVESGLEFAAELTLYLVHSWLHLAGLEDHDDAARNEMRQAEEVCMDHLHSRRSHLDCHWEG